MQDNIEKKYLIALSHFSRFGAKSLGRLKKYFLSYGSAWAAKAGDLTRAGISAETADSFVSWRRSFDIDQAFKYLEKDRIEVFGIEDQDFPGWLKDIADPPALLYVRGSLAGCSGRRVLAVVGTRKMTDYGRCQAAKIAQTMAQAGFTIVSGLALGIDSVAHQAALKAGGLTAAVLATGVDRASVYPRANYRLSEEIIARGGALLSEFPPGTLGLKHHFPQRNRIIAGMSRATLVVEAGAKSGALITAYLALDYGREVMAVPGPVDSPVSIGPNSLIQKGARLAAGTEDILAAFDLEAIPLPIAPDMADASPSEQAVLALLRPGPQHIDEIIRLTNLTASDINSTMMEMELRGMVRNKGGMVYMALM